jgi:DNA-binding NarL/FixJ family response regulator
MIRVVIADDHPALRAGLRTVLEAEPGIVVAGDTDGGEEGLWPLLNTVKPDIVLLDYHLPRGDGLQLCYRIKQQPPAPKVVLFTAYASPTLSLPAAIAHADALVAKGVGARELFEVIRLVNRGERLLPPISRTVLEEGNARLPADDHALVGMLLDGATESEIASTLMLTSRNVRHRVQRILAALRLDIPAAQSS